MSIKLMTAVWESGLPARLKTVALCYADFANDRGEHIYPSIEYVSWKTGLSHRSVQNHTKDLAEMGVLHLLRAASGRPGDTNVYRFDVNALPTRAPFREKGEVETGADFAPVHAETGADFDETGAESAPVNGKTGATFDERGAKSAPDPLEESSEKKKKVRESKRERERESETNPLLSLSENTKEIYALLEKSGISPRSPRGRDVLARGHPLEYVRAHVEHWQREGKSAAVLIRRLLDDDPLPPRPEERRAAQYVIPPEYVDLIVR